MRSGYVRLFEVGLCIEALLCLTASDIMKMKKVRDGADVNNASTPLAPAHPLHRLIDRAGSPEPSVIIINNSKINNSRLGKEAVN